MERPDYRFDRINVDEPSTRIVSAISLRKDSPGVEERTFCFFNTTQCDCNTEPDCNDDCSCNKHKPCNHCHCVDYRCKSDCDCVGHDPCRTDYGDCNYGGGGTGGGR